MRGEDKLVQWNKTPMEKPASQSAAGCKPLTTFVQTDTDTFGEIVQRLTGQSESNILQEEGASYKAAGIRRPTTKLHERRHHMRPKLQIVKPAIQFKPSDQHTCFSPSKSANSGFSPRSLTPSAIFSKLSIVEEEHHKGESAPPELNTKEEEKAIKERRFYLHPSPRTTPGYKEPTLLTLFPLISPKTSEKP